MGVRSKTARLALHWLACAGHVAATRARTRKPRTVLGGRRTTNSATNYHRAEDVSSYEDGWCILTTVILSFTPRIGQAESRYDDDDVYYSKGPRPREAEEGEESYEKRRQWPGRGG